VLYKPYVVLVGIFLGSYRTTVGQTPPPPVLAHEQVAPIISMLQTTSTALPPFSFLPSQDPEKSNTRLSLRIAGAYQSDYSFEHLSPIIQVKTVILTQSSLPLVQFWGGHLQLDAFQSTLHIQSAQLGLIGAGGMRDSRLSGQMYPGGPRSVHLSGLSLSFRFGRDARTGHPAHLWRRVTRIVEAVLN
jgi:hypothetical protein